MGRKRTRSEASPLGQVTSHDYAALTAALRAVQRGSSSTQLTSYLSKSTSHLPRAEHGARATALRPPADSAKPLSNTAELRTFHLEPDDSQHDALALLEGSPCPPPKPTSRERDLFTRVLSVDLSVDRVGSSSGLYGSLAAGTSSRPFVATPTVLPPLDEPEAAGRSQPSTSASLPLRQQRKRRGLRRARPQPQPHGTRRNRSSQSRHGRRLVGGNEAAPRVRNASASEWRGFESQRLPRRGKELEALDAYMARYEVGGVPLAALDHLPLACDRPDPPPQQLRLSPQNSKRTCRHRPTTSPMLPAPASSMFNASQPGAASAATAARLKSCDFALSDFAAAAAAHSPFMRRPVTSAAAAKGFLRREPLRIDKVLAEAVGPNALPSPATLNGGKVLRSVCDALGQRRLAAEAATTVQGEAVVRELESGKKFLPLDFLFSHNMKDYCQRRGGALIMEAMRRFVNLEAHGAIAKWKSFVEAKRQEEKQAFAVEIQKVVRGWLHGRIYIAGLRKQHAKPVANERERKRLARVRARREHAAGEIERVARGATGRRLGEEARCRLEAIRRVQNQWRGRKCRLAISVVRLLKQRKLKAALDIERCYRGMLGRRRYTVLAKDHAREKREKTLNSRAYIVKRRLIEYGAAVIVQRNWRTTHSRTALKFEGHKHASVIQARYRGVLGRRHASQLSGTRAYERYVQVHHTIFEAAAFKVQHRWRGHRGYQRVKSLREAAEAIRRQRVAEKQELLQDKLVAMPLLGKVNVTRARRGLKGINPLRPRMERKAAERLQRAWRVRQAKRLAAMERRVQGKAARHAAATMVQRAWRSRVARFFLRAMRVARAASRLQAQWRGYRFRQLAKDFKRLSIYAVRIQRHWRGRMCRAAFIVLREVRRRRSAAATRVQRPARAFLARARMERRREFVVVREEHRTKGIAELAIAVQRTKDSLLLLSIHGGASATEGELQIFYRHWCATGGNKEGATRLNNAQFAKLARETGIQCDKLPQVEIDLIFVETVRKYNQAQQKSRQKQQKRGSVRSGGGRSSPPPGGPRPSVAHERTMRYGAFLEAMITISARLLPTVEEKRAYSGPDAKLMELVERHVLSSVNNGKHGKELQRHLNKRTTERLHWAASVLQRRYRGACGRSTYAVALKAFRERAKLYAETAAATKLQLLWRQRSAYLRLLGVAQALYKCFVDIETGTLYWVNPRTGIATYERPTMLRGTQTEEVVRLPAVEEQWTVHCEHCNEAVAGCSCDQCLEILCDNCFGALHRKGKRAQHTRTDVAVCVECRFQVATRSCDECDEPYCDSCFLYTHRAGSLLRHSFTPLVDMCTLCSHDATRRAARYHVTVGGGPAIIVDGEKHRPERPHAERCCVKCFAGRRYLSQLALEVEAQAAVEDERIWNERYDVIFDSIPMRDRAAFLEAERKHAEDLANEEAARKEREDKIMFWAATRLQKIVRGRYDRGSEEGQARLAHLLERREFRCHRRQDDVARGKRIYKLRAAFGVAPKLDTDTEEERALASHSVVGDALRNAHPSATGKKAAKKLAGLGKLGGRRLTTAALGGLAKAAGSESKFGGALATRRASMLEAEEREARAQQTVAEAAKWEEIWDEASQCSYYFNNETEESSWEKPQVLLDADAMAAEKEAKTDGKRKGSVMLAAGIGRLGKLANRGKNNDVVGQDGGKGEEVVEGEGSTAGLEANAVDEAIAQEAAISDYSLSAEWEAVWDDTSQTYYYYNNATGESSWEAPADYDDGSQYAYA